MSMIPKLRRKFISITAAALFAMILLVIAAINCIFIIQDNKMLDSRLDRIMNERAFDDKPREDVDFHRKDFANPNADLPENRKENLTPAPGGQKEFFHPFDMKLMIRFDGCLIYLNPDGTFKELRQDAAEHYSQAELKEIAEDIYNGGKESGWRQYFKFRMETATAPDGAEEIRIGLINASSDLYSVFTVLLISIVIGAVSFLLVLLIIIFASGRAVKPIAESYSRQKQFVTDAGHELKTPLTVISANNELARIIYGGCEWFDGIDAQVAKMNSLIHSLITLARMDEEQAPVFTSFNLSDAVYDTAKSFEQLIHGGQKLITFDIADDIYYLGDESKLRQVVSILMDNAAKYCDKNGKISVKLTMDKQIRLQVINDYAQATACDLSRVFERFYRADKARTPDGSYGLGLPIAKSIVELHKGEIHAKALEHDRLLFEVLLGRGGRK